MLRWIQTPIDSTQETEGDPGHRRHFAQTTDSFISLPLVSEHLFLALFSKIDICPRLARPGRHVDLAHFADFGEDALVHVFADNGAGAERGLREG